MNSLDPPFAQSGPNRRDFLRLASAGSAAALLGLPLRSSAADAEKSADSDGKPINTATGTILPSEMGITSLHEHIPNQTDPAATALSREVAIRELIKAREHGIRTIVEVGPLNDPREIRAAAVASGVNIICCTGFYTLSPMQKAMKAPDFERVMTRQFEEGLQDTGIRPGVIKTRSNQLPIAPVEREVFTAAARMQQRFGVPICIHSVTGCADQQAILEAAGADLTRCYFSHVEAQFGWEKRSVPEQVDYFETVVKKGSTLCFNNFGNWNHTKPEALAEIIRELTARGYDDRMAASMDATWKIEDGAVKLLWADTNEGGEDRTYSYLTRKAVPWMESQGIPRTTIDKMLVANPRRIFTA